MTCYTDGGIINADNSELSWEVNHTYSATDCDPRFHIQINENTCLSACPGDSEYDTVLEDCYVNCEEKYGGAKSYLDNKSSKCLNYVEYRSITDPEDTSAIQALVNQHTSLKIDCGPGTKDSKNPFIPCVCPEGYQRRA